MWDTEREPRSRGIAGNGRTGSPIALRAGYLAENFLKNFRMNEGSTMAEVEAETMREGTSQAGRGKAEGANQGAQRSGVEAVGGEG